jgi:hypothetical protein
MAEKVVVMCDVCGGAAAETVALKVRGRSLQKDLCQVHLTELSQGARQARRGSPPAKPGATPPDRPHRGPQGRRTGPERPPWPESRSAAPLRVRAVMAGGGQSEASPYWLGTSGDRTTRK